MCEGVNAVRLSGGKQRVDDAGDFSTAARKVQQ